MFNTIKQYRREFVYVSYIFLVLELLVTKSFVVSPYVFIGTSLIGLILLLSWFVVTLGLFGKKKVSSKSTAYITVNFGSRVFSYVVMPVVFWFSLSLFLFFSEQVYISQAVIVISSILYFLLLLKVRTSLERVYSVDILTRYVFDFTNIVIFYLLISVLNRSGFTDLGTVISVFLFSLLSLHHMLYLHRKMEVDSTLTAVFFSSTLAILSWYTRDLNIYMQPAILATAYYLIVSWWNVRFSGSRNWDDYIPPLMYSLMAIILILSL